jgi:succinate dehydrogenase / fumarate reductase flavoprotein subunit
MGGIKTNIWGETAIEGLYAAGECACVSVHGANRLGGNALLETVVFGKRAGTRAAERARVVRKIEPSNRDLKRDQDRIHQLMDRTKGEPIWQLREELGKMMNQFVGIFRTREKLEKALGLIQDLRQRYEQIVLRDKERIFNMELTAAFELGAIFDLAQVITASALFREESRGAHYRLDFPKRDDDRWLKHTLAYDGDTRPRLGTLPVTITRHPPQERSY